MLFTFPISCERVMSTKRYCTAREADLQTLPATLLFEDLDLFLFHFNISPDNNHFTR